VLVDVLREWAGFLEVLVIDWEDNFGEREKGAWKLEKSVLEPIGGLEGVSTRVGRVVGDGSRKVAAEKYLTRLSRGLDSVEVFEGVEKPMGGGLMK
jgi:hypothetical protein